MSELLLQLRSASTPLREEMLQKEDAKGLKAICAGLGQPSGGTAEQALQRIQEVLRMEDDLYTGVIARIIQAVGQLAERNGDVLNMLQKYKVAQLKDMCKTLALPQSGRKALLADRIASKAMELWQVMKLRGAEAEPSTQKAEFVAAEGVTAERAPATSASSSRRPRPAEVEEVMQVGERSSAGDTSRVEPPLRVQEPLEAEVLEQEQPPVVEEADEEDEEEEDAATRSARRFRERRSKLMGYVVEENATVYGEHKKQYLKDVSAAIKDMPDTVRHSYLNDKLEANTFDSRIPKVLGPARDTAEYAAWHVEPYSEEMHMVGELGPARVAYCKWWDRARGCGEVVDAGDQGVAAVLAAALTTGANVAPTAKYLVQGEVVEYRRVRDADIDRGILVRGVRGWPLTCEMDGAKALPG